MNANNPNQRRPEKSYSQEEFRTRTAEAFAEAKERPVVVKTDTGARVMVISRFVDDDVDLGTIDY